MQKILTGAVLALFLLSSGSPAPAPAPGQDELVNILLLSDIHLFAEADQSPAVTRNSDSGTDLWDSAKKKITAVLSGKAGVAPPKFIVYLGDLPWHAKDSTQTADAVKDAGLVLSDLRMMASKAGIPLIFVPGNNDSPKGDYGPFSMSLFKEDASGSAAWPVIGGRAEDTSLLRLGCYTVQALPGLKVLVLNSTVFTARYRGMVGRVRQNQDAGDAMDWLYRMLDSASHDGQRVLIAMHVPPGKDGYRPAVPGRGICDGPFKDLWDSTVVVEQYARYKSMQDLLLQSIGKFNQSVVGIVASHTHMDGVRVLDPEGDAGPKTLLVSVPGITPGHGNNPGFKVLSYDATTGHLKTFRTFYEDFFSDQKVKHWGDLYYDFSLDGITTMDPAALRRLDDGIYTVHHGTGLGMGNCVDTTLYVHHQR